MTHIIYTYLIINSFILGWHLREYRYETVAYKTILTIFIFLLGAVILPIVYILPTIIKPINWLIREIKFQYRFRFTDFWDKILLDDSYSDIYKTIEEKLQRANKMTKGASKQVQRHNKLIQKRYGK